MSIYIILYVFMWALQDRHSELLDSFPSFVTFPSRLFQRNPGDLVAIQLAVCCPVTCGVFPQKSALQLCTRALPMANECQVQMTVGISGLVILLLGDDFTTTLAIVRVQQDVNWLSTSGKVSGRSLDVYYLLWSSLLVAANLSPQFFQALFDTDGGPTWAEVSCWWHWFRLWFLRFVHGRFAIWMLHVDDITTSMGRRQKPIADIKPENPQTSTKKTSTGSPMGCHPYFTMDHGQPVPSRTSSGDASFQTISTDM